MARIDVFKVGRGFHVKEHGVRIQGAETLDAALAKLDEAVRREILEIGLRAGATVIQEGAQARVADHAEMAQGIEVEIADESGKLTALIGPRKGRARGGMLLVSLAYWREFGTQAHKIVAGARARRVVNRQARQLVKHGDPGGAEHLLDNAKIAGALASRTQFFGKSVDHPGTVARPFLRPAFDEDGPRAQHVMGQTIWDWIRANVGTR